MTIESTGKGEIKKLPELTPEQETDRDDLLEYGQLHPYASVPITMRGQTSSLAYGLGYCSEFLIDMTPEELRKTVFAKITPGALALLDPAQLAEIEQETTKPAQEPTI